MVKNLKASFERWADGRGRLVLASVYETEGSTYSKPGAQMLINADGDFQGMLSGGCLEGDLAERARSVATTGEAQAVTYDLGPNEEELWGLGVGCDGLMRIFLQPLEPDQGYEPFATVLKALDGDSEQVAATVIESDVATLAPGQAMVTTEGELSFSSVDDAWVQPLSEAVGQTLLSRRSATQAIETDDGHAKVLFALLRPPPSILVLGGGLDAGPVVRFAIELGWRVTVQDHRSAYIESGNFDGAKATLNVPVDELSNTVDLDRFDAAIVMSHHLVSDRSYLDQLSKSRIKYIGLLGPVDRRKRLLDELGETGKRLGERVHGPAGLDIGGRGPASIALSIIAEMHQVLMRE